MNTRTVLAFGTFDVFHDGHRHFLTEAKKLGDQLVVVLPHDQTVSELKDKKVINTLENRIKRIQEENIATTVCAGDTTPGTWNIVKELKPQVVAIGHDQQRLAQALLMASDSFDFEFETVTIGYLPRT